jgi:hypothetical protein
VQAAVRNIRLFNEEKRKIGESNIGNKVVAVIGAQARPDRRNREQFRDHAYRADGGAPGRRMEPDDRREVVRWLKLNKKVHSDGGQFHAYLSNTLP